MNPYLQCLQTKGINANSPGVEGAIFVLFNVLAGLESPTPASTPARAVLKHLAAYKDSGGYLEIARAIGDPSL